MLRYIFGSDLHQFPTLSNSMFRDRAAQFRDRLGWDVTVDENGHERDQYDALDPLYVIWERPDGRHGGSMRLMPTTGRTMVNEHFNDLMGGREIRDPGIWESTRFCLAPKAPGQVAAALTLGSVEVGRGFGIKQCVGVFDARMVRIYRMIGAEPEVLGSTGEGRAKISVGLWTYDPADRARVLGKAGLSSALSEHWYARAFGARPDKLPARAA